MWLNFLKALGQTRIILMGIAFAATSVFYFSQKAISPSYANQGISPFHEEVFAGEISPPDYYRSCRIDSHGNLFLVSHMSVLEKIAVDGSPSFAVNLGAEHLQPPIGIHSYAVAPDDSLFVAGVDHARTGTVIYHFSAGDNTPTLYARLDGVEPGSCAFGVDGYLYLVSLDSAMHNEIQKVLHSKEHDKRLPQGVDVLVRRMRPDKGDYRGYGAINLPTTQSELNDQVSQLENTFLNTDPDGDVHIVNHKTTRHTRVYRDGTIANSQQLNLAEEGRISIFRVLFIGAGYFLAHIGDAGTNASTIKGMRVIAGREGSNWTKQIDLPFSMPVFYLDSNSRANQLLQYYFVNELVYIRRYRLSDILHTIQ